MKAKKPETFAEYIKPFPKEVRNRLQEIRRMVRRIAPGAKEAIKYGIPTFVQEGNMISIAAYKHHIGFYPAPKGSSALQKEMAPYRAERATLQFPLDEPLHIPLIRKIVKARVKEFLGRKKKSHR